MDKISDTTSENVVHIERTIVIKMQNFERHTFQLTSRLLVTNTSLYAQIYFFTYYLTDWPITKIALEGNFSDCSSRHQITCFKVTEGLRRAYRAAPYHQYSVAALRVLGRLHSPALCCSCFNVVRFLCDLKACNLWQLLLLWIVFLSIRHIS
jgi:hypothetical protein